MFIGLPFIRMGLVLILGGVNHTLALS